MNNVDAADPLTIGGQQFDSRLLVGTGKYSSDSVIPDIIAASGSQIVTAALRRVDFEAATDNVMQHIPCHMQLLPDGHETVRATEILAKDGFVVLPYINADPVVARQLEAAGAAAVMPLGASIGTNRGLTTREMLQIIIDDITVPVVVDAGIGKRKWLPKPGPLPTAGSGIS